MTAKEKKFASNVVLAGMIVLTIAISLFGTAMLQSSGVPADVPIGSAHINVNVMQSPAKTTGDVTLFVLPGMR